MRPFRCLTPVALAALSGLATGACGLGDVFRPSGLNGVVVSYLGAFDLSVGMRIAPDASVELDVFSVLSPCIGFFSSNPTILFVNLLHFILSAFVVGQLL